MTTRTLTTQIGALVVAGQLQFDPIVNLVLDGLTSSHSRRAYSRALTDFLTWPLTTFGGRSQSWPTEAKPGWIRFSYPWATAA